MIKLPRLRPAVKTKHVEGRGEPNLKKKKKFEKNKNTPNKQNSENPVLQLEYVIQTFRYKISAF